MLLLGLSAGHKVGLGATGAVFVVFALVCALLVPRYRPDFPGRVGLRAFVIVALALFVAMMAAVTVFGKESEAGASEKGGGGKAEAGGGGAQTVNVTAKDFSFAVPKTALHAGKATFDLKNDGPSAHDLVVTGPGVNDAKTPVIASGKTASVTATLEKGSYELYCSVPGHKQLGMDVKINVA